jgi:hypothetical protein
MLDSSDKAFIRGAISQAMHELRIEFKQEISDFRKEMNERFMLVLEEIRNIRLELAGHNSRITKLEKRTTRLEQKIL